MQLSSDRPNDLGTGPELTSPKVYEPHHERVKHSDQIPVDQVGYGGAISPLNLLPGNSTTIQSIRPSSSTLLTSSTRHFPRTWLGSDGQTAVHHSSRSVPGDTLSASRYASPEPGEDPFILHEHEYEPVTGLGTVHTTAEFPC